MPYKLLVYRVPWISCVNIMYAISLHCYSTIRFLMVIVLGTEVNQMSHYDASFMHITLVSELCTLNLHSKATTVMLHLKAAI